MLIIIYFNIIKSIHNASSDYHILEVDSVVSISRQFVIVFTLITCINHENQLLKSEKF